MTHQRKRLGGWGEQKAKEYLLELGYQLISQNWRNRLGEIDLIMFDGIIVVFVEVRTKKSTQYGLGFESVNMKKQQQLLKMANSFLQANKWWDVPIRFDVVSIDQHQDRYQLRHMKNVLEP